ncbi:Sec-independent protein translocase protein TatB [bacterium HR29]|mgnify:CR=1 FL=1|nr:Sec-independent protein translocase protein TatB [bacterium HR29]
MEFLGIGYQEILAILLVALIFLGPERLPQVAYQLGRAVRTMQRYARLVRDEFREELQMLEEEYKGIRAEMEAARAELRAHEAELRARLEETNRELERVRREAQAGLQPLPAATSRVTPATPPSNGSPPAASAATSASSPASATPRESGPPRDPLVF